MIFCGCERGDFEIKDGTYRAEFSDYDVQGYKDYVEITFEDEAVTSIEADAVSEHGGTLKSEAAEFKNDMQLICGTYPEKYYKDLINQYLDNPESDNIDIVAGATWTSNDFIALVRALEKAVREGNTDTVIVKRK